MFTFPLEPWTDITPEPRPMIVEEKPKTPSEHLPLVKAAKRLLGRDLPAIPSYWDHGI